MNRRAWGQLNGVFVALVLSSTAALAHKPSDSYATLDLSGAPKFRLDLAIRDLDDELSLDANGDGKVTWGEVVSKSPAVDALVQRSVVISQAGQRCTLALSTHAITPHSDGAYLVLEGPLSCPAAGPVSLTYSLFFARDPQHRALIRLTTGETDQTLVAGAEKHDLTFDVQPSQGASLGRFLLEGIRHILIGADHLLFLTALLLPSVLRRRGRKRLGLIDYEPRDSLKPALAEVLKLVTAFTVAHSITLALSALDIVELPSRLVESTIALTVMVAALSNLWPLSKGERWGPAFTLGLVHGFGFSSVLKDLGLRGSSLIAELFGFNIGVELGQLSFVAVVVPLAYLGSRYRFYPAFTRLASVVIAVFGLGWLIQRAFF